MSRNIPPATGTDVWQIALRNVYEGRLSAYTSSTAAPAGGSWAQGDVVRNSNPTEVTATEGPNYVVYGWINVAAGTPGSWEEMRIPTATVTVGWDDLRFPVQAINPVGGIDAPTQDQTETAFPGTLLFSGSRDDMIAGVAQLPHRWKRGSSIVPHIHWSKPTGSSSAVTWELFIRDCKNPGEAAGSWSTAYTGSIVAGDQTITNGHLITSFGEVTMTDREESAILAWRLYRRGSTDAEANAVRLLEVDFHYQTDKYFGTATEIPV